MEAVQQVLSVLFVFCLLGLTLWGLRGGLRGKLPGRLMSSIRGAATGARPLESIDRLVLSPQHCLHLVRLSGKELLIATHPQGCTLVSESQGAQKGAAA